MKRILLSSITFLTTLATSVDSFAQTLYWGGAGGAWNSSGWSTSDGGSYNSAWVNNSPVVFNVDGTIAGPTATLNFLSLTCNANVSFSSSGSTIGTNSTIATIDIAAGKTFDFGPQAFGTGANNGYIKNGLGTLALSGATYGAGFTLNDGTVVAKSVNTFGQSATKSLNINGGTIAADGGTTFGANKFASIIVGGNFTLGSFTAPALSTANLTFASPVILGSSNRTITLNGTGINTFSGVISSTGGGLTTGAGSTGTLTLSGANTYTGPTTLSGGTLTLGAADVIPDASPIVFNGGTLKTGAFNETYSTINLSENSTILLNNTVQTHNFATSNAVAWISGKTLTIKGWQGGYNSTSGTRGKIFVGSDAIGLTATQLQQIKFYDGTVNYDATILSTGEIVPSSITVLPISLTSFTAKPVDKTILLNWATASEKENKQFEVLKSADGKNFKVISTMNGAGNSDTEKSYAFVDENPFSGANYYQLKQTDFNGNTATSTVISANAKIEDIKLSAYASSAAVTVNINSPSQTDGEIHLFDMNGRKLESKSMLLNKGYNELVFNQTILPGTYFINLLSAGKSTSFKFIKK